MAVMAAPMAALTVAIRTNGVEGAHALTMAAVTHIEPSDACGATTPFGGAGAAPACNAGPTAEVRVPAASAGRTTIALGVEAKAQ